MGRDIKSQVKNIAKSKDSKTLFSNFAYLTILQVAGYVFPLLTIPYLAEVLGVDGYGKIAFAGAVVVWMNTFADWGFLYTSTRDVARCREDKEKVSHIYSNTFWAKLMLYLCVLLALVLVSLFIPKVKEYLLLIFYTSLMIPGQILFADWFYQALERMKFITYFNLLVKVIFTASVFIFIKEESDYIYHPLLMSLGYLITGLVSMYYVLYRFKYKIYAPNFKAIIKQISSSKDIFINLIGPNLYNSLAVVLLGVYAPISANGILSAGSQFPNLAHNFVNIISRVFYPYLVRKEDKHKYYVMIVMLLSFMGYLILWLIGPYLLDYFYTEEFEGALQVLRVYILGMFFVALKQVYSTYLMVHNKDRLMRNITLISSIFGFFISIPLIKNYSYMGVAYTFAIASTVMSLAMTFVAIRHKRGLDSSQKS